MTRPVGMVLAVTPVGERGLWQRDLRGPAADSLSHMIDAMEYLLNRELGFTVPRQLPPRDQRFR